MTCVSLQVLQLLYTCIYQHARDYTRWGVHPLFDTQAFVEVWVQSMRPSAHVTNWKGKGT